MILIVIGVPSTTFVASTTTKHEVTSSPTKHGMEARSVENTP